MEEEHNYTTVIFKEGKERCVNYVENTIYDEVKTDQQTLKQSHHITSENGKTAAPTRLQVMAVALGILCVILVSVIIGLTIHYKSALHAGISESYRGNLTAQNRQLWTEKKSLERQREELTRERDRLNWTVGVILEYDNFPVHDYCPQKVCKPCLKGWKLFQSSCYLFTESSFSSEWKKWEESRSHCRENRANLVEIGSQEEQEFINNHTEVYNDERHGYWIGLKRKTTDGPWLWVDGGIPTVKYWMKQQLGSSGSCTLTVKQTNSLNTWDKASCYMKNRWICETKALIKSD